MRRETPFLGQVGTSVLLIMVSRLQVKGNGLAENKKKKIHAERLSCSIQSKGVN